MACPRVQGLEKPVVEIREHLVCVAPSEVVTKSSNTPVQCSNHVLHGDRVTSMQLKFQLAQEPVYPFPLRVIDEFTHGAILTMESHEVKSKKIESIRDVRHPRFRFIKFESNSSEKFLDLWNDIFNDNIP